MKIAYHASHEQFSPASLLAFVIEAEKAGFDAIHSSDHFQPWSERQGQCGFTFAWLGAAMQSTRLPFSIVCAPGQRYHPALVAQAIATLANLFPDRFHISLGSGEAINESIVGVDWPPKKQRNQRLFECTSVIRRLLAGEEVTHDGMVKVEHARLYTLPETIPPLFGAAMTKETAGWMGNWVDGLVTMHKPREKLRELVMAFRDGGGSHKPMHLKIDVSYASDENTALIGAHEQWRTNVLDSSVLADIPRIEQIEQHAETVTLEQVREHVIVTSDIERIKDEVRMAEELGFEMVILHNVNRDQSTFIADFGKTL